MENELVMESLAGATETAPLFAPSHSRSSVFRRTAGKFTPWLTRIGSLAVSAGALVVFVIVWNELSLHHVKCWLDFSNVPSAQSVAKHLLLALKSPDFYANVWASVERVWISFGVAAVLGIAAGLAMARVTILRLILNPFIELFRPIPAIAWIPLSILMFPTTESSILFIVFLGALFPIVLNTYQGAREVPEQLTRAAKSLGADDLAVLRHIVIPSALPNIVTGLSVGMGIAWFSLLTGEMIGGRDGIGNYTWEAYQLIQYANIVVGMITIGLLSTLSTWLIQFCCKPLIRWSTRR